jgi:hypothetical protein
MYILKNKIIIKWEKIGWTLSNISKNILFDTHELEF